MLTVTAALKQRISIRKFLPTAVPEAMVRELLDAARWSPSGGNLQPWKVIAVAGAERAAVTALANGGQSLLAGGSEEGEDPVYPPNLWEPYRTRRFQVGEDMYALLGIRREDRPGRLAHVARNFEFFGAPVGLFFVIDRRLGRAQWAHLGMFMQSLALVAVERGLGTCMQEFWGMLRQTLHRHFALPESDTVYCGMALGYPDMDAPVNHLRSTRAAVEDFATLRGF
jgi:nitroreductase